MQFLGWALVCSECSINVPGSTVVMLLPTVVMGMIMMVILKAVAMVGVMRVSMKAVTLMPVLLLTRMSARFVLPVRAIACGTAFIFLGDMRSQLSHRVLKGAF